MRKNILKFIAVFLTIVMTFLCLSACSGKNFELSGRKEKIVIVDPYEQGVGLVFNAVQNYESYEYEAAITGNDAFHISGVIYLTESEAKRLKKAYNWQKAKQPDFEFTTLDAESLGDGPWLKSSDFVSDNYSVNQPQYSSYAWFSNYTVFDGEKLVFDVAFSWLWT